MMAIMTELIVDFGNPASIAEGIPKAEALLDVAEQRRTQAYNDALAAREREEEAEAEAHRFRQLLAILEQLSPELPGEVSADPNATESSKQATLRVVTAINGPTSIGEVAEELPHFNRKTISWALWTLADEKAIQKLGHGRYAPLGYRPGMTTTDQRTTARLGMPVAGVPAASQLGLINQQLADSALKGGAGANRRRCRQSGE